MLVLTNKFIAKKSKIIFSSDETITKMKKNVNKMFFYLLLIFSFQKENQYSQYLSYCDSTYKHIPQEKNFNFEKVIIFFCNGDRAPLNVKFSSWQDEDCKVCFLEEDLIEECKIRKCLDGDLSIRGYEQMKILGDFVKDEYGTDNIFSRCSIIPRTQTSLYAVYKQITDKNPKEILIPNEKEDKLLIPKDCSYLKSRVDNQVSDHFRSIASKDKKINKELPQRRADHYLTSVCNNIILDCEKINCNEEIISEYMRIALSVWNDQTEILMTDEFILQLTFGRFVNELIDYLNGVNSLYLISMHDAALSMILAGFGTQKTKHPSYASAVFLEVWNDNEIKYVRVIYNDKQIKTTIDDNYNIPLDKFISYLDILKKDENEVIEKCKNGFIIEDEKINFHKNK